MDFRRRRGYHIVFWKKETTPKTYKNVKAENHNPYEGERKTPEKQLRDLESISLQEKDFRLMIMNVMQGIGNRLEAKTDNLQETLSKEIQNLRLKQAEMKNTITEI